MLFLLFVLLVGLTGCLHKMHDTIDSLPVGAYSLDKSFESAPEPVRPIIARIFQRKGFVLEDININSDQNRAARYRYVLSTKFTMEQSGSDSVLCLKLLITALHNRNANSLITIRRTLDPRLPVEQNIKLMVTALENKFPILSQAGTGSSTFEVGPQVTL